MFAIRNLAFILVDLAGGGGGRGEDLTKTETERKREKGKEIEKYREQRGVGEGIRTNIERGR